MHRHRIMGVISNRKKRITTTIAGKKTTTTISEKNVWVLASRSSSVRKWKEADLDRAAIYESSSYRTVAIHIKVEIRPLVSHTTASSTKKLIEKDNNQPEKKVYT